MNDDCCVLGQTNELKELVQLLSNETESSKAERPKESNGGISFAVGCIELSEISV